MPPISTFNKHLLSRGLDAPMLVSFCLSSLAGVAGDMGDHARALSLAQEALAMRRVSGDQNDVAFALYTVGTIVLEAGAMAEAQTCYSEGIDIARSLGHVTTLSIAIPLGGLGVIAYRRGDPSTARTFLTQSLDVSPAIQHRWQTADSLTDLARLHADAGDYEAAEQMLVEAVEIYSAIGKRAETALALRNRAWLQECRGDFVAARALYLESEALLERTLQEGRLALVRADFGRMLARAGETARSQGSLPAPVRGYWRYPQPHVEIITLTGLGILERGRGNSARASNHFIEALDMAHKSQELCEGIKTLYELACLLAENERFGKAVPLFEYLFQHPATPFHIRSDHEIYRDKIAAPMGLEPSSTEQATRQAADFRTLVEWVRSGGVGVL